MLKYQTDHSKQPSEHYFYTAKKLESIASEDIKEYEKTLAELLVYETEEEKK